MGAYQYHMDPSKTIDPAYKGKYNVKDNMLASDIINLRGREIPVAPSLCMSDIMDGTNTPAHEGTDQNRVFKLSRNQQSNMAKNFPKKFSEDHMNLLRNMESPRIAPILGEFTNLKPPMFLDYDPTVKNAYKGIIYIAVTNTDTPQDLRHENARMTAYDSRNDPAWHYEHGTAQFEVLKQVRLGPVSAAIKSLDDFNITDDDGNPITQDFLDDQLNYLNGKKSFDGLSARNTGRYIVRRQRYITKTSDGRSNDEASRRRDKSVALGAFNKSIMLQIQLVNRLHQGRIAVVFLNFGSGGISATLRNEGGLFNPIPKAIFEPAIEFFASIQDHFDLITNGALGKTRYIDYLHEDASLNYLTFKPRHGRDITKRPSEHHKKWPDEQKYSTDAQERYGCFSESVDLNSNMADLVVIKNDREIPIMDYLVVLQGSPLMTSHFNHVANVLPHWHIRNTYDKVKIYYFSNHIVENCLFISI